MQAEPNPLGGDCRSTLHLAKAPHLLHCGYTRSDCGGRCGSQIGLYSHSKSHGWQRQDSHHQTQWKTWHVCQAAVMYGRWRNPRWRWLSFIEVHSQGCQASMRHPVSQGRSRKHCNNTAGVFAYIQHLLYADLLKTRPLFCENMHNVSEYTVVSGHKGNVCMGNTTRNMLKHIPIILLQA